ncbi:MAG TPA: cation:dicarboxylase symporter family transporter, partial [Caulobacteraceae bacterium]
VWGVVAAYGLHAVWPIDPEGGARLLAGAPAAPAEVAAAGQGAPFAEFLKTIAPANPIRAAAEDAILGVVVFALFFGFAATRQQDRLRLPLVTFFEAVGETMIVIVRWVLKAAPIGIFAMAVGVGLTAGVGAAGTLAQYIAMVSLAMIGVTLICYPLVMAFGRIGLGRFARGAAPAQVVAFSTQSSLASLPVMVERAVDFLGAPRATAGLVLPLAVAVFRITSPVANLGVVIYCAHLFGLQPTGAQIVAGMLTAVLVSIASVGLPGQVSFFVSIVPICAAMGVPTALLPLLLAVEVVPDIFRTVGNVTGDLAATRIVQGRDAAEETEPELAG